MTAETRRHVDAEPGLAPRRLIFGARVAVDDPYSTLVEKAETAEFSWLPLSVAVFASLRKA